MRMTEEQKRIARIQTVVEGYFLSEWFDVDMLSELLTESAMKVTPDEAFKICALNLGNDALRTFEFRSKTFYNEEQAKLLNDIDELRDLL